MIFTIEVALKCHRELIANMMEKYLYELSQYENEAFDEHGLFGYPYLDLYWSEEGRCPFLLRADGMPAGFILVNKHPECDLPHDYSIAECFVAYPYRRQGLASQALRAVFRHLPGRYHIRFHPGNEAAARFWRGIAAEYAADGVTEVIGEPYGNQPSVVLAFGCKKIQ